MKNAKPKLTVILNKKDWRWLLRKLDSSAHIEFAHQGAPERFPCVMESNRRGKGYVHVEARKLSVKIGMVASVVRARPGVRRRP